MQNEGVSADIGGHHQPAAVHLLPQCPDVYGQWGQVATGRDQSIGQQDGTAKVQCDKATRSWMRRTGQTYFFKIIKWSSHSVYLPVDTCNNTITVYCLDLSLLKPVLIMPFSMYKSKRIFRDMLWGKYAILLHDIPECIRSMMMDWCGGGCRKWDAWEIAKARPLPMGLCSKKEPLFHNLKPLKEQKKKKTTD